MVQGEWIREEEVKLATREHRGHKGRGAPSVRFTRRWGSRLVPAGYLLSACLAAAAAPALPIDFAEIQRRATVSFQEGNFFKPVERDVEALTFRLAPLLIQEVQGQDGANASAAPFGTLVLTNGTAVLDTSRPAIYFQTDGVLVHGKPHVSFTYIWFYKAQAERRRGGSISAQGVRLTLNSAGEPVVWEILAEPSGAELIFVSHSLEAAALAQFGKPLPGRRYAVERGTNETPGTVVARVIEDGPVPMGPIVYLRARTHMVSTLICRCMPAQAKKLRATGTYGLLPFPEAAPELVRVREDIRGLASIWRGEKSGEKRLQTCLRLPAGA